MRLHIKTYPDLSYQSLFAVIFYDLPSAAKLRATFLTICNPIIRNTHHIPPFYIGLQKWVKQHKQTTNMNLKWGISRWAWRKKIFGDWLDRRSSYQGHRSWRVRRTAWQRSIQVNVVFCQRRMGVECHPLSSFNPGGPGDCCRWKVTTGCLKQVAPHWGEHALLTGGMKHGWGTMVAPKINNTYIAMFFLIGEVILHRQATGHLGNGGHPRRVTMT